MDNLAFKITNDLLNAGVILESAGLAKIERIIQARLSKCPQFRKHIVHFAKRVFLPKYADDKKALCGRGNCSVTEDKARVTCLNCLRSLRVRDKGHGYTVGRDYSCREAE